MGKLIDPKKKNSIMVGENTATPYDIAELFGRNPDMTNYVAPQAAAQTVAQPTAGYSQRMQQEADASQARVDDYFKKNPMTGNVFQDIGGLLATREDRKRATKAREYMEAEEGRGVTRREQDIGLELGRGELGIKADVNKINKELGLGELDINKSILSMHQDRYNNITKPSDILSMAEKAAGTKAGIELSGLEPSDVTSAVISTYIKGDSTAKPKNPLIDESMTMYNKVPEQFPDPITGLQTATSEARAVSPIFQGLNLGTMLGKTINRAATPVRSSLRRKVKKGQ